LSPAEIAELFRRRLIALDWGRKDSEDAAAYTGRAKTDVLLFNNMRQQGAAVVAAYKGATEKRSHRVIGSVEPGTAFVRVKGLLCLPLVNARIVDSSSSFVGNLAPRSCTVQSCSNRARGRLAALVRGTVAPRTVWSLHHLDVEWLVTNYLTLSNMCESVWSGGRSYEDIDHAGYAPDGRELLAQTTISTAMVPAKAARLAELARSDRHLCLFGPTDAQPRCPLGIEYHTIESVFATLDASRAGQWLITRMLGG
jgi:hypothetical protein